MNVRILPSVLRGQVLPSIRGRSQIPWICAFCRKGTSLRASFSSSNRASDKPFYITTPIFYVNAAPHVGHLYTMVLTDVLKRWQVLQGKEAILCTGTDEHGMKVQQAAAKVKIPPKEFCDLTSETFRDLAARVGIANDYFIRTTDEAHRDAVQYFWYMLKAQGYIYEKKHEGWYCVSDETFYPETSLEKRLDPHTGKTFMAAQETGKEVEWTSELNYHFRLSAFKDRLLDFYKENPEFVVPAARMRDVVNWVSAGLEDLSVSRPVERLTWGIPVPDDPSQTIYVWLDALVNYITVAGYPWAPGTDNKGGWPADVQVVGKDIVRFHCIYWPAFLMAIGLEPPKQILAHAHWTLGHQKMAKSTGNVVNPLFAMDRFGVDVMRYYLAHDGGISDDADYGNHMVAERYKKGLQGGLGNLTSRISRTKVWSVRKAIEAARDGKLMKGTKYTKAQASMVDDLARLANLKMEQLDPGAALRVIMDVVYQTNKYLQDVSPWNFAKETRMVETTTTDADGATMQSSHDLNQDRIHRCVYHCAEAIRVVAILLQPYMPTKAAEILDIMGVDEDKRTFEFAKMNADHTYGVAKRPPGKGKWEGVFPPLAVED
ncbi:methionyl-tRNA synthetase-like protein [Halenospora varia]|nr:methionyl-tRNA synthetase-like protein [Halenospora varia]